MTWGKLDSTPVRLDEPRKNYSMQRETARERAAEALSMRSQQRKKENEKLRMKAAQKVIMSITPNTLNISRGLIKDNGSIYLNQALKLSNYRTLKGF